MLLRYNVERISEIIKGFKELTGIGICMLDADMNYIIDSGEKSAYCAVLQKSHEGLERCRECDREILRRAKETRCPVTHTCYAGLSDTAVPLYQDELLLGFVMFGQLRPDSSDFNEIYPCISDICVDRELAREKYASLVRFDPEKIKYAAQIVEILTKYVCVERMIQPEYSEEFDEVIRYLEANLSERDSIDELCRRFHISKNKLYGYFRGVFDCTVCEYIEGLRIREAKRLLAETNMTLSEICCIVGMDNCQYFCRRFKRAVGLTPIGHRKSKMNEEKI